MAIGNKSIGIAFDGDFLTVSFDNETHRMQKRVLDDMMAENTKNPLHLLHNISISAKLDGISSDNTSALKSHVEGKTFKW